MVRMGLAQRLGYGNNRVTVAPVTNHQPKQQFIHLFEEIKRYQCEFRRGIIRDRPKHALNTHTGQPAAGAQSLSTSNPSPVGVGDGAGGDFVDSPDLAAEEVGHSSK